jgi:hypothetical protein
MRRPGAQRLIGLLAALSERTDLSVGCYCEDEGHCHRSLLRVLLEEKGARIEDGAGEGRSGTNAARRRSN